MNTTEAQSEKDNKLLEGLTTASSQAIVAIYDLALPSVIYWVKENTGTEADARDIFQEALIALFRRVEKGDFQLTCSLKSYLRIVCRNLWMARLRQQSRITFSTLADMEAVDLDQDILQQIEQSEKMQLYFQHFDALGEKCQQILMWFFDKVPLARIAERLNTSENYIKKRKFICKKQLIESIQEDIRFKEILQ